MPRMSLEPPPWKMSSAMELTLSVTKLDASAPLTGGGVTLLSAKTWSQSCVAVVTAFPSSSNTLVTLSSLRFSSGSVRGRLRFEWDRRRVLPQSNGLTFMAPSPSGYERTARRVLRLRRPGTASADQTRSSDDRERDHRPSLELGTNYSLCPPTTEDDLRTARTAPKNNPLGLP